jgi:hypothetical protein
MKAWLPALLLLAAVTPASAYTCTGSSCTLDLEFDEPSTYVGGAPLKDLKDHVFTYQRVGGPAQTMTIPASRPQGGQHIVTKTAAQTIEPCTTVSFTGSLVSRTTAGSTSAAAPAPQANIDRSKLPNGQPDPACSTPAPSTSLKFACTGDCVLEWGAVTGATQYRVVKGVSLGDPVVATTTSTTATITPPTGVSDYTVYAVLADGSTKMIPMRVTVIR